jgi:hypothetical protein
MKLTLVVPLRCSPGHSDHRDLREHLASLLDVAQVIVVDNSDGPEFEDHARASRVASITCHRTRRSGC